MRRLFSITSIALACAICAGSALGQVRQNSLTTNSTPSLAGTYRAQIGRTNWPDTLALPPSSARLPDMAFEMDDELADNTEVTMTNTVLYGKSTHLDRWFNKIRFNNWWDPSRDGNGNLQAFQDSTIYAHSMDYMADWIRTNGWFLFLQIAPGQPPGAGNTFSDHLTGDGAHMLSTWHVRGVMIDMAGGTPEAGNSANADDVDKFQVERYATALRQIAFTNAIPNFHLTLSAYVNPHGGFQPWFVNSYNSFTLGPDGEDVWSDFLQHEVWYKKVSQHLGPGQVYNFNVFGTFGGDLNKVRGAIALRAGCAGTMYLGSTNFSAAMLSSITNALILDAMKDPLVQPGKLIATNNFGVDVFIRELQGGRKFVTIFNPNGSNGVVTVPLSLCGIYDPTVWAVVGWSQTNRLLLGGQISVTVTNNSADFYVLSPRSSPGYFIPDISIVSGNTPFVFTNGSTPALMDMNIEFAVGDSAESPSVTIADLNGSALWQFAPGIDTGGVTGMNNATFKEVVTLPILPGEVIKITDTSNAGAFSVIDFLRITPLY